MKKGLMTFAIMISVLRNGDADEQAKFTIAGDFHDPRQSYVLTELFKDGKKIEEAPSISHSLLIIAWFPDPNGKFSTYQISGIDGYYSRGKVEQFLDDFYKMLEPEKKREKRLNVILADNNWGFGEDLHNKLAKLSKEYKFSVFMAGGWAFNKAVLIEEPINRLKMIKAAFEKTEEVDKNAVE